MGVPIVKAPCEAEAQAASLARGGYVWGVGTEDMDALTFRCVDSFLVFLGFMLLFPRVISFSLFGCILFFVDSPNTTLFTFFYNEFI